MPASKRKTLSCGEQLIAHVLPAPAGRRALHPDVVLRPRAVRLSQADQLRLERLASAMGCSGSEAIRRAVREALERRLGASDV